MSDIQEIVSGFAEALENGTLGGCDLRLLIRALDGVPDCFHLQIIKAAFGMVKPDTEEAPEDYAVVKTFDSNEFHVGDEVTDGINKHIIIGMGSTGLIRVFGNDSTYAFDYRVATNYHRTGRNFPAISAILDKIRK